MPETSWAQVLARQAEYEAWADDRLVLDTSADAPEKLLIEALRYVHRS